MPLTILPTVGSASKAYQGQSRSIAFTAWDCMGSRMSVMTQLWDNVVSLEAEALRYPSDGKGKAVKSQLLPISNATADLQSAMLAADILPSMRSSASHELAFMAELPPLGYTTYTISEVSDRDSAQPSAVRSAPQAKCSCG